MMKNLIQYLFGISIVLLGRGDGMEPLDAVSRSKNHPTTEFRTTTELQLQRNEDGTEGDDLENHDLHVEKDMDEVAGNYTDASNISPIFITTLWMVADYFLIFFNHNIPDDEEDQDVDEGGSSRKFVSPREYYCFKTGPPSRCYPCIIVLH
jgi:hypothetical protein